MSDETVTVTDTVVPVGSKVRGKTAKKANVKNAKNPKEAVVTTKFKSNTKSVLKVARLVHLVSDATRSAVLLNLAQGPMNVTELCKVLGFTQPATSHHLALLRASEVVEVSREGKFNNYSLGVKGKTLVKFLKGMMETEE